MTQNNPSPDASIDDAPPTFDILPLSHEVRKAVDAIGYTHPTPVQRAVFESVASGRDVVVQARTGTGKTAAFGLPIVDRLVDPDRNKPQVLVLCPTRELALQIHRELELLSKFNGVSTTAVYGGAAMQPQVDAIARGVQVIAGTPGRVLDHLERGTLKAKSLSALVLDESDEMLSMGFLPQITKIMEQLPSEHQTLLFSATLPPDVKRIADSKLTDPEFITLSGDHIGALSIDHYVYRSTGRKAEELVQLIEIENPESAIIFCNTRDQTKQLATALQKKGFAADWLNADLAQKDREKVMAATRESKLRFLVCTDVAARGIDISHLTHVINADFPESTENYVHRTGRTGRAGRTGTAISLITPQDVGNLYMLRLTYKIFPIERDLPRPLELKSRKEADLVQFLLGAFSAASLGTADRSLARRILASDEAETIVAGLVADHLGAHPKADETAAELRRERAPRPVEAAPEAEEPKKKKKKKKKDKGEKLKEKPVEASSQVETPAAEPAASRPKTEPKSSSRATPSTPASEHKVARSGPAARKRKAAEGLEKSQQSSPHELVEATKQAESNKKKELPKAKKELDVDDEEPMEVISAADLLSDAERALLRGEDLEKEPSAPSSSRLEDSQTENSAEASIFVNVGQKDDITEDDFLDTLADVGFPIAEVLAVVIRDTHSFLRVPRGLLNEALECLDGEDVAGLEVRAEEARPKKPGRGSSRSRGGRGREHRGRRSS